MNMVLDQTVDVKAKQDIGMVVGINLLCWFFRFSQFAHCAHRLLCSLPWQVVRGNSVITIEALEPV